MSLFHTHEWEVVSTDYTPPVQGVSGKNLSMEIVQGMLNGTTHVYSKCKGCGELRQQDFLGKFNPTLQERKNK